MHILPVIDLLHGEVVHAVRGQRENYQPIRSALCETSRPADIAHAIASKFSVQEAYVADLDAIGGRPLEWPALRSIHQAGLRMWLDAGLSTLPQVEYLLGAWKKNGLEGARLVIGLETWRAVDALRDVLGLVPRDDVVFSLDLRDGVPITASDQWPAEPLPIVQQLAQAGFENIIVLDLAQVGTNQGPASLALCREIKRCWPHLRLISGGGIRNLGDCRSLVEAGCSSVLVASAIHSGAIQPQEIVT